jgi:phosphatidylserine/phosphatidylglycerophosphate/cardiolipin synthase-like enzyme
MPLDVGSIEVFMGPQQVGGPDNLLSAVTDFISAAKKKLFIAVQELESRDIATAILAAKSRGVKIRIILESKYLGIDTPVPDPWLEEGKNEDNRQIVLALLRAGIEVIFDLNPATFHQKYIVRDPDTDRAAVLTGSTNFTPTGTGANLNHIVVFKGKRLSGLYHDEFEEAWTGTFGRMQERRNEEPKTYRLAHVRTKILFAPDHAPELEIMKQILKAKERVDFAMFTFAQSSGIDDAMICLNRSGIPVRGVLDRSQGNQGWAATRPIKNAGAELFWPRWNSGIRKVHHKLVVIDDLVTIIGSFNHTGPANRLNDENIAVIGDRLEKRPDALDNQHRIARYAREEIDRIIHANCEPVP